MFKKRRKIRTRISATPILKRGAFLATTVAESETIVVLVALDATVAPGSACVPRSLGGAVRRGPPAPITLPAGAIITLPAGAIITLPAGAIPGVLIGDEC